jgi:hypothetical protein
VRDERGGPVVAVEVVKRVVAVELAPGCEFALRDAGLQLADGFAEREGKDVPEPRLAALG